MSDPRDDDTLEIVASTTCPHCVIMAMMRALVDDRSITPTEAARYAFSALAGTLAMVEPAQRTALIAVMILALPGSVDENIGQQAGAAGETQH